MQIPEYVLKITELLEKNGFSAYIVGGCVRDYLLEREVHDFDIASSALPEEMLEIFKAFKTVKSGMKHGTVAVVSMGRLVEVTTFRSDGAYSDLRRPDSVSFVRSIDEDLSRRDFTINAMAHRPGEGITDPYGGREDLKRGIIRCVGNPWKRFSEDALRIMRGMRFSSVLGFEIENETMAAMLEKKPLLQKIAKERITAELRLMLLGDGVYTALMSCREIIFELIPELRREDSFVMKKYPDMTLWEHTVKAVELSNGFCERLCMLLHDIAKPDCRTALDDGTEKYPNHAEKSEELAREVLSRFRLDSKSKTTVLRLIKNHSVRFPKTLPDMRNLMRDFGGEFTQLWLDIKYADVFSKPHKKSTAELYYNARAFYGEIKEKGLCCSVSEMNISGSDLKNLGFVGRDIGNTLERLLDGLIDGKYENEREILIKQAAGYLQ